MHKQLQAIITVLSLINPAICAAMFARASPDSRSEKDYRLCKGSLSGPDHPYESLPSSGSDC